MSRKIIQASAGLLVAIGVGACEMTKSEHPLGPTVAGPIPGVNITAPRPLEPFAGSTITFNGEPQTLLIENAGSSGPRSLWLQLEVGTDAAFRQVVHQADQIALGSNGRTSYRLPAPLGAGYTYYWRTRAADGANTGPYSEVASFAVIPPTVVNSPVATSPSGSINTNKPEFKVTNGAISGTSGVGYLAMNAREFMRPDILVVTLFVYGTLGFLSDALVRLLERSALQWRPSFNPA